MLAFKGDQFIWYGTEGCAEVAALGLTNFPQEFDVSSQKSGKTLRFIPDRQRNEANEFFDGEATAYRAQTNSAIMVMIRS